MAKQKSLVEDLKTEKMHTGIDQRYDQERICIIAWDCKERLKFKMR